MALESNEYIWSITYTSLDDGHRLTAAWFTDQRAAHDHCDKNNYGKDQKVVQTQLWRDTRDGYFYKISREKIDVDKETIKQNALNKLTDKEKEYLGVEV